jgi:hypothetical protein
MWLESVQAMFMDCSSSKKRTHVQIESKSVRFDQAQKGSLDIASKREFFHTWEETEDAQLFSPNALREFLLRTEKSASFTKPRAENVLV